MKTLRGQGQLFDPATTRGRTEGELSPDEWHSQGSVQFHASFRPEWKQAPTAHMGSKDTAVSRLDNVSHMLRTSPIGRAQYYDASATEDSLYEENYPTEDIMDHVGRLYARKLDPDRVANVQTSSPVWEDNSIVKDRVSSDANANAADMRYWRKAGYASWEIPASIRESSTDDSGAHRGPGGLGFEDEKPTAGNMSAEALQASVQLSHGKALRYTNIVEGGDSYVVPDTHPSKSWDDVVLADPNASSMAKQYAQQRKANWTEGAVEIPESKGSYEVGVQPTLTGGGQTVLRARRPAMESIQFRTGPDD